MKSRKLLVATVVTLAILSCNNIAKADTSVGTYSELQSALSDSTTTGIVTLTNNLTAETSGLNPQESSELIINGNNKYIDGIDTYSGFNINSGKTLTIQNLTIKNTLATTYGGAIFNNGTIANEISANFTNNSSMSGGAIANLSSAKINGNIVGIFDGNYAKSNTDSAYGGAIANIQGGVIDGNINGKFINNYATSDSYEAYGGAILNSFGSSIKGLILGSFDGNYAKSNTRNVYGGAIANIQSGMMNGINADFKNNYATSNSGIAYGGAIFNAYGSTINGDIVGTFDGNYAKSNNYSSYGGAIANINSGAIDLNIGRKFINNYATSDSYEAYGGAIFNAYGSTINGDIVGSFDGNYAKSNTASTYGGAIASINGTEINANINGNFIKNYATSDSYEAYGGAILNAYGSTINGDILGSFDGNYVQSKTEKAYGGAIANINSGTVGNIKANFTNNYAKSQSRIVYGGALYNASGGIINGNIEGSFDRNYAQSVNGNVYGGAIANANGGAIVNNIDVNFTNNYAVTTNGEAYGGAFANEMSMNINNISSNFTNNHATATGGHAFGGALYDTTNIKGNISGNFNNNYAEGTGETSGGAIYSNFVRIFGSITGDFINNHATSSSNTASGGAIFNTSVITGDISGNFIGNYVRGNYNASSVTGGGAISISKMGTVQGAIFGDFTNNYAISDNSQAGGGAIDIFYSAQINNGIYSNFTNNYAKGVNGAYGGAIYAHEGSILNDLSGSFTNNYAESQSGVAYGGALYLYNVSNALNVSGDFTNNHVSSVDGEAAGGGAFLKYGGEVSGEFSSDFTGNYATSINGDAKGGAIYTREGGLINKLSGSFTNNYATSTNGNAQGGAIYIDKTSNITISSDQDILYSGNYVKAPNGNAQGGAIYVANNGTLTINPTDGHHFIFVAPTTNLVEGAVYDTIYNEGTIIIGQSGTQTTGCIDIGTAIAGTGTLYLNEGSLHIIDKGTMNYNGQFIMNGGSLSLLNENISDTSIQNLEASAGNISIDWGDNIVATNVITAGATLTDVGFSSTPIDGSSYTVSGIQAGAFSTYIDNNKYTITSTEGNTGVSNNVTITKLPGTYGLADALHDTQDIKRYTAISTYTETKDLGQMQGSTMTIAGNGNIINCNEESAISLGEVQPNQTLTIIDANIKNLKTSNTIPGAITLNNDSTLNINAVNSDFTLGDNSSNSINQTSLLLLDGTNTVNISTSSGRTTTINGDIISNSTNNILTLVGDGNINLNGVIDPITVENYADTTRNNYDEEVVWNLNSGTLKYSKDNYLYDSAHHGTMLLNSLNFNGGNLDLRNGYANTIYLDELNINSESNIYVDADLANSTMDKLVAQTTTATDTLHVAGIKLISDTNALSTTINFTENPTLMGNIDYTGNQGISYSPIFKYNVAYDETNGNFNFSRVGGGGYKSYNPAVLATPVATQTGSYLTQLNSYEQAFTNYDMIMALPKSIRQSMATQNKYAISETKDKKIFSIASDLIPEQEKGAWFRPYASFETVNLHNGPKVSSVAYGSFIGGDSQIMNLSHGWNGIYSLYVGYNGSHQTYDGVGIYQNGGQLGGSALFYKGNFFTGLTANVGANVGEADTMYGNDNFTMLASGVASKTGYNFELNDGKFIIQPNFLMSYTFVNTFDYKSASGVRINSDPLNAIQIAPGLKFIGNLKNGLQPYVGIQMVWNIMDDTRFHANNVSLPEFSVKPYIQYGVGLQKRWGERFTAFGQAMIRNGGRNGIALQFGFRWALGKNYDTKTTNNKTVIKNSHSL